MNDVKTQGIYYQNSETPSNNHQPTEYGLIRVIAYNNELIQLYSNIYDNGNRQPMSYIRNKMANGWSDWHELAYDIPSFYKNYNDLASLANALGVWQKNNAAVTDYNDCIGCGYWVLAGEAQNQPTQLYGLLFGFGISANFVQVALDCRLSATIKVYMRTKWLDNWSDWCSVTLS